FQVSEPGFTHQHAMPEVPPPESVATDEERFAALGDKLPQRVRDRAWFRRPFEIRTVDAQDLFAPVPRPGSRRLWMRSVDRLPDGEALHKTVLAYACDFSFVTTALEPHGVTYPVTKELQIASLDHIMWFHQPVRCDEWLLHVIDSPAA